MFSKIQREHGGSVSEGRIPEREVRIRSLHTPLCVLEQDTLLPENIGNTVRLLVPCHFYFYAVSKFSLRENDISVLLL